MKKFWKIVLNVMSEGANPSSRRVGGFILLISGIFAAYFHYPDSTIEIMIYTASALLGISAVNEFIGKTNTKTEKMSIWNIFNENGNPSSRRAGGLLLLIVGIFAIFYSYPASTIEILIYSAAGLLGLSAVGEIISGIKTNIASAKNSTNPNKTPTDGQ